MAEKQPSSKSFDAAAASIDTAFDYLERAEEGTWFRPEIGWRTVYAALCVLSLQGVGWMLWGYLGDSIRAAIFSMSIAIVLSVMTVRWAIRAEAAAVLRREVLPQLAARLLELCATDAAITEGWHRLEMRRARVTRQITLQEVLKAARLPSADR